jgi:RHS repeat-associated protein
LHFIRGQADFCSHCTTLTLDGATYAVDNAGNRTTRSDLQAGVTTNYGYDAIYQLLNATQGNTTESYTYDPVGNRLSSLGVASYSLNTSNELPSTSSTTYGYDNDGNAVTKTDSNGTTTYTWDFENRLTSVTLPASGGGVTFKYDPFGRRIYKSSSTATSVYAYDGDDLIEEVNAAGGVVARYAAGSNVDEPFAMLRSSTTSYYQADGLGSVTSLSNSAGAIAQTYAFDSFGKQTASSGSLTNPFQYTGRELDSETGLYFLRNRYYDPQTGRFVSEDPGGFVGGIDMYAYVTNNPANLIDPFGLQGGGPYHPPAGIHTKCTEDDSCSVIKGKMWLLQRMIASHTGWDRIMPRPRGGNKHSQDIADLWKQLAECQALAAVKCKDCDPKKPPNFPPVPIPYVGPILDKITDPMLDWLKDTWDDLKHWHPQPRPIWGPVPVPVPIPIPVPI